MPMTLLKLLCQTCHPNCATPPCMSRYRIILVQNWKWLAQTQIPLLAALYFMYAHTKITLIHSTCPRLCCTPFTWLRKHSIAQSYSHDTNDVPYPCGIQAHQICDVFLQRTIFCNCLSSMGWNTWPVMATKPWSAPQFWRVSSSSPWLKCWLRFNIKVNNASSLSVAMFLDSGVNLDDTPSSSWFLGGHQKLGRDA